jgi:hypothetical protein
MAQIVFENPNAPEQPAKGVYRWFYRDGENEITIYVGCAGNRRETVGAPSTLKRGIQEAQRSCVTSDRGKQLDTDFVVGTAIAYVKSLGFDCIWQHVADDPTTEPDICKNYYPLLQGDASTIGRHFRLSKPDGGLWSRHDIKLAEDLLLSVLRDRLHRRT